MLNVLCVMGPRPEIIKMAPVIRALRAQPGVTTTVCLTGQHREMGRPVLAAFGLEADVDLDVMRPDQSLADLTAALLTGLDRVVRDTKPDWVLAHSDTTSTLAAALVGFYRRAKIAHVEAGLRTGDLANPFPEEANRRLAEVVSDLCFAPTQTAVDALLAEGVPPERIVLTGNAGIDALLYMRDRIARHEGPSIRQVLREQHAADTGDRRIVLVTGHRRESFGAEFEGICEGIKRVALENPDVAVVYPVHLNPNVQAPVRRILTGLSRVHLTGPLDYPSFVALLLESTLVLTDSGGIQEEAPALGKPVLVLRHKTERPEGVAAGVSKVVGTDPGSIAAETHLLLTDPQAYALMARGASPYGDGHAAERIVAALVRHRA